MAAALAEIPDAASDHSAAPTGPPAPLLPSLPRASASADIIIEFSGLRRSCPRIARNIWRERSTRLV
jgi:hypothetical protein